MDLSPEQINTIVDIRDWMYRPTIPVAPTQRETIENIQMEMRGRANEITAILVEIGYETDSDIPF